MQRRSLVFASLCVSAGATLGRSRVTTDSVLRLGADSALVASGLAGALQRSFGRETGLPVQLVGAPATPMLESLAAGELDAGLANASAIELPLERQGLIHSRRAVARGEFLLVGPRDAAVHAAGPRPGTDLVGALRQLRDLAALGQLSAPFLSLADGSGSHLAEQAAWRAAAVAPEGTHYQLLQAGAHISAEARKRGAYAIVERGEWLVAGGASLQVLVAGDPLLAEPLHAMRAFRSPHPVGKLFMNWIVGARGRAVVAAHRGYRLPAA